MVEKDDSPARYDSPLETWMKMSELIFSDFDGAFPPYHGTGWDTRWPMANGNMGRMADWQAGTATHAGHILRDRGTPWPSGLFLQIEESEVVWSRGNNGGAFFY